MKDFRKLKVWEKAHQLALLVYKATATFPREELYGLTSQIRRSGASIPTNIAEGCGRDTDAELAQLSYQNIGRWFPEDANYAPHCLQHRPHCLADVITARDAKMVLAAPDRERRASTARDTHRGVCVRSPLRREDRPRVRVRWPTGSPKLSAAGSCPA